MRECERVMASLSRWRQSLWLPWFGSILCPGTWTEETVVTYTQFQDDMSHQNKVQSALWWDRMRRVRPESSRVTSERRGVKNVLSMLRM